MAEPAEQSRRFLLHLRPLQGALETFCRRSLYETELLEDVLQEAVLRAFRDFGLFTEGTAFRAWLFRYVHLCVLEANRRSRARRRETLEIEPAVNDPWQPAPADSLPELLLDAPEAVLEECDETLSEAILTLRELDRAVLLLKAIGEFKYREIADILGIPMGTVMSSLSRARQQVRQRLARFGGGEGMAPSAAHGEREGQG